MKDTTYAISFDKKDYPSLLKYAERVRETHNQELVDNFNLVCRKKWDDHTNVSINGMELLQVSKADDLVTSEGVAQCMRQILGTSTVRWQFMGFGYGSTTPTAAETTLVTEALVTRADMSLSGWREYASSTLRFAAIFGELTNALTNLITEIGIFTTLTGGSMLNRTRFLSGNQVSFFGVNAIVFSSVIEFVPII